MKFVPFPSIEQFRNVIRNVKDRTRYAGKDNEGNPIFNNAPLPTLTFNATVKMHGTNAAVSMDREGNIGAQSRNNMLDLQNDNAGWCAHVMKHKAYFKKLLFSWLDLGVGREQVTVFGEWCGGGIQKGVALNELDKMFVVFAVNITWDTGESCWLHDYNCINNEEARVFNSNMFKTWEIDIDFNNPELIQNELIRITQEVEAECPVGKHFGVSGIGEGIVLTHKSDAGFYIFKSKGVKHSASKVKKLNSVDVEQIENVKEFVSNVVTLNRLEQGIQYLKEQQLEAIDKNIGHFIKWMNCDVMKEESDTIAANDLDAKLVAKEVSNAARKWYFQQIA